MTISLTNRNNTKLGLSINFFTRRKMAIKVAFRRKFIVGITNRHKQHKQRVLQILHKIRTTPGFFKPGFQASKAAAPKSIPQQPKGLNKTGAGLWSSVKKGWSWIKSKFHKHKGKVVDAAKKHGKAIGSRLYAAGKKVGTQVVSRAVKIAENNVRHYTMKAEKKLQSLADRAEFKISQYDKPKKGSGVTRKIATRVLKNYLPVLGKRSK